jgi:hypothetical protein
VQLRHGKQILKRATLQQRYTGELHTRLASCRTRSIEVCPRISKKHTTPPQTQLHEPLAGLGTDFQQCRRVYWTGRSPSDVGRDRKAQHFSWRLDLVGRSPDVSMSHENTGRISSLKSSRRRYRIWCGSRYYLNGAGRIIQAIPLQRKERGKITATAFWRSRVVSTIGASSLYLILSDQDLKGWRWTFLL